MSPRHTRAGSVACACLLALALSTVALADIAPPETPPGSSIGPGGQTQVRMLAERVRIDIQPRAPGTEEAARSQPIAGDAAQAHVSGDFTMRNLGDAGEQMQVRFPLDNPSGRSNDSFNPNYFPEVQGFMASVGGQSVATTVITTPASQGGDRPPIPWAAFDVSFPAGQDLNIGVTYTITPTGYLPEARFAYVLETGAGWRDSIGSVDIVARLPYAATDENVLLAEDQTTPGGQFAGNEVRWHWENLEPTAQDNFFVTVIAPGIWQAILDAREAAQAKPDDVETLVALAMAYEAALPRKGLFARDNHFASLGEQAYERAVMLQPDSATLHAGLAEMLWRHWSAQATLPPDDPHVRRVVSEVSRALALDPQNEQAKRVLSELRNGVEGEIVLVTPTIEPPPTAMVADTALATVPPSPRTTSAPAVTPAPATTAPTEPTRPPALTPSDSAAGTTPAAATQRTGGSEPALLIGLIVVLAVAIGVVALLRRGSR